MVKNNTIIANRKKKYGKYTSFMHIKNFYGEEK